VFTADSGNTKTYHFCPTCGSRLHGKNSGLRRRAEFRDHAADEVGAIGGGCRQCVQRANSMTPRSARSSTGLNGPVVERTVAGE
jgi:hypothetical protein